jgi:hypothetical protein
MRALPTLLRGARAIAAHLELSVATAQHMHQQGTLPTFRAGSTPYATVGALDEWRQLQAAGELPTN